MKGHVVNLDKNFGPIRFSDTYLKPRVAFFLHIRYLMSIKIRIYTLQEKHKKVTLLVKSFSFLKVQIRVIISRIKKYQSSHRNSRAAEPLITFFFCI